MIPDLALPRPVLELMGRRYSCRTFAETEIPPERIDAIHSLLASLVSPEEGVRFAWMDKEGLHSERMFTAGTYGMIKGNRWFVAGIIRAARAGTWEELGTRLEMAVLKFTEWGLGTCWIGGVFDRKRFGRYLRLAAEETIPVVIAVGLAEKRPALRDRLVRWSARGDSRKDPRSLFFFGGLDRPLSTDEHPRYVDLLESVRLAPSASNKQPWRIILSPPRFHFYLDRDRFYSRLIAQADLQRIDMGIARCHFHLAAKEAGIGGEWQVADPQLPGLPDRFEYCFSFRVSDPT